MSSTTASCAGICTTASPHTPTIRYRLAFGLTMARRRCASGKGMSCSSMAQEDARRSRLTTLIVLNVTGDSSCRQRPRTASGTLSGVIAPACSRLLPWQRRHRLGTARKKEKSSSMPCSLHCDVTNENITNVYAELTQICRQASTPLSWQGRIRHNIPGCITITYFILF